MSLYGMMFAHLFEGRTSDPKKVSDIQSMHLTQQYGYRYTQDGTGNVYVWDPVARKFNQVEKRGRGRPAGTKVTALPSPTKRDKSAQTAQLQTNPPELDIEPKFNVQGIDPLRGLQQTRDFNPQFMKDATEFLKNPTKNEALALIAKYEIFVKEDGSLRGRGRMKLLGKVPNRGSLAFMEFLKQTAGGIPADPKADTKPKGDLAPNNVFLTDTIRKIDVVANGKETQIKVGSTVVSANTGLLEVPTDELRNTDEWKNIYSKELQRLISQGDKGTIAKQDAEQRADVKIQMMVASAELLNTVAKERDPKNGRFKGRIVTGGPGTTIQMKDGLVGAIRVLKDLSIESKMAVTKGIELLGRIDETDSHLVLKKWNEIYVPLLADWEKRPDLRPHLVALTESLSALLCKEMGAEAILLPEDKTFELGDVIALYPNRDSAHNAKGIDIVIDLVSVKKDGGAGGAARPRVKYTAYRTREKNGKIATGMSVKRRLTDILNKEDGVFRKLFYSDDHEIAMMGAERDLDILWKEYDDVLFTAVGFSESQVSQLTSNPTMRKSMMTDIKLCWRSGHSYQAGVGCSGKEPISVLSKTGCAGVSRQSIEATGKYFEYGRIIESIQNELTIGQAWSTHVHRSGEGVAVAEGGYDDDKDKRATVTKGNFMPYKKTHPNSHRRDRSCVPSTQFPLKSDVAEINVG